MDVSTNYDDADYDGDDMKMVITKMTMISIICRFRKGFRKALDRVLCR